MEYGDTEHITYLRGEEGEAWRYVKETSHDGAVVKNVTRYHEKRACHDHTAVLEEFVKFHRFIEENRVIDPEFKVYSDLRNGAYKYIVRSWTDPASIIK
jgi:hypothetical protein